MDREAILELIQKNLEDGKLSCGRAHKLVDEHGVKLWEIGKICEEEKIKIKGCLLGCF